MVSHTDQPGHAHDPAHGSGNLRLAFYFNLAFTLIEVAGGFWTDSIAVLSDAMHDMGDVLVLGAAWYMSSLAVRGRDGKYSYGYGRYGMLGGWLTALVLAIGSVVLMVFTLIRMRDGHEPYADGMILLGVFGLAMNGFAAWKLHGGASLNERGAYLHLLEDVLGWAAVLVGAVVIRFTGWTLMDPLLSVAINLYVLYNALGTLRKGTGILMQRLPEGYDERAVTETLLALPHVVGAHDLHAWTLDGTYTVLTVHLLVDTSDARERAAVTSDARRMLSAMDIDHATIELELPGDECALEHH